MEARWHGGENVPSAAKTHQRNNGGSVSTKKKKKAYQ